MQDSQKASAATASRRKFFVGAAGATAAATVVAVLPKVDVATDAAQPSVKPAPEKGGGYSLSEHVKHYYRSTSA